MSPTLPLVQAERPLLPQPRTTAVFHRSALFSRRGQGGERASLLEFTTVTVAAPLHRSTLTVGEREGKRWRLAVVESLPSWRLAGHPPSHTLVAAPTAVNHNRHHGCRGGFAGGHRCRVRCCGVAHYS
nr:hypothetical protein Iba_scaffold22505CG0010 [Ipomoea batatas]